MVITLNRSVVSAVSFERILCAWYSFHLSVALFWSSTAWVWARWLITVVTATSTASTLIVKATGRIVCPCSACSCSSCASLASTARTSKQQTWPYPSGTKARAHFCTFATRLKSCPFAKNPRTLLTWTLFTLPARSILRVFDQNAFFGQVLADLIGARKVAAFLGHVAFLHQGVDFVVVDRSLGQQLWSNIVHAAGLLSPLQSVPSRFGIAVLDYIKDCVEGGQRLQNR